MRKCLEQSLKECIAKDATFDAEFAKKIFKTASPAGGSAESSPKKEGASFLLLLYSRYRS